MYSISYAEKETRTMTSSPKCFILIILSFGLQWGSPGPWFSVDSWESGPVPISTIPAGGSAEADFSLIQLSQEPCGPAPLPTGQFHKETACLSLSLHLPCVSVLELVSLAAGYFKTFSSQVCFGTCKRGSPLKQNGCKGTEMGSGPPSGHRARSKRMPPASLSPVVSGPGWAMGNSLTVSSCVSGMDVWPEAMMWGGGWYVSAQKISVSSLTFS